MEPTVSLAIIAFVHLCPNDTASFTSKSLEPPLSKEDRGFWKENAISLELAVNSLDLGEVNGCYAGEVRGTK